MQTPVNVDSELLQEVIRRSGTGDASSVVEKALRLLNDVESQEGIRALRGKIQWDGDLDEMRATRSFE